LDYLRSFDCTTRSICQNLLNHYKARKTYLSTLPRSVHPITINLIKCNITLLELTFEYTVWCQPNKSLNESQITYYTDEEK